MVQLDSYQKNHSLKENSSKIENWKEKITVDGLEKAKQLTSATTKFMLEIEKVDWKKQLNRWVLKVEYLGKDKFSLESYWQKTIFSYLSNPKEDEYWTESKVDGKIKTPAYKEYFNYELDISEIKEYQNYNLPILAKNETDIIRLANLLNFFKKYIKENVNKLIFHSDWDGLNHRGTGPFYLIEWDKIGGGKIITQRKGLFLGKNEKVLSEKWFTPFESFLRTEGKYNFIDKLESGKDRLTSYYKDEKIIDFLNALYKKEVDLLKNTK